VYDIPRRDLPSALSQFQSVSVTKEGTFALVQGINESMGQYKLPSAVLRDTFDKWWESLKKQLEKCKKATASAGKPIQFLDTMTKRTEQIIADMKALVRERDVQKKKIRYSGFLSPFAITDEEIEAFTDLPDALKEERDLLRELASQGAKIRCIITPPTKNNLEIFEHDRLRLRTLLEFWENKKDENQNIEWAVSPFRQKNLYIFGTRSCIEGFKKADEHGYPESIRLADRHAVDSYIRIFDQLMTHLRRKHFEQVQRDLRELLDSVEIKGSEAKTDSRRKKKK